MLQLLLKPFTTSFEYSQHCSQLKNANDDYETESFTRNSNIFLLHPNDFLFNRYKAEIEIHVMPLLWNQMLDEFKTHVVPKLQLETQHFCNMHNNSLQKLCSKNWVQNSNRYVCKHTDAVSCIFPVEIKQTVGAGMPFTLSVYY